MRFAFGDAIVLFGGELNLRFGSDEHAGADQRLAGPLRRPKHIMAREHLLLIDADTESADVMELGLRQSGYSVARAADPDEALSIIEKSPPSLLVCDLDTCSKPEDLLEGLVLLDIGGDARPCIFICDETLRENFSDEIRPEPQDCLAKPVYLRELVARVQLVMEGRRRAMWSHLEGGRTRFSGELGELGVVDILQTIEVCKKSGVVTITSRAGEGEIWFKKGALVDASFGKLQAEAAVYRMVRLHEGSFGVQFKEVRRAKAMSSSTHGVLLEGLAQLDRWHRYCEQLPDLDTPLIAAPEHLNSVAGPSGASADVSELLRRFKFKKTVRSVLQETRRNDLELLAILSEVYFTGALVIAGENTKTMEQPERELIRIEPQAKRTLSTTEPMIHDGPMARPRPRSKSMTQRMHSDSAPVAAPPVARPRRVDTGNSHVGQTRVARTLVIPYSARVGTQETGGATPRRRPVSPTVIYHEDPGEQSNVPFAKVSENAVLAQKPKVVPEPVSTAVNSKPPVGLDKPVTGKPALKIVENVPGDDERDVASEDQADLDEPVDTEVKASKPVCVLPTNNLEVCARASTSDDSTLSSSRQVGAIGLEASLQQQTFEQERILPLVRIPGPQERRVAMLAELEDSSRGLHDSDFDEPELTEPGFDEPEENTDRMSVDFGSDHDFGGVALFAVFLACLCAVGYMYTQPRISTSHPSRSSFKVKHSTKLLAPPLVDAVDDDDDDVQHALHEPVCEAQAVNHCGGAAESDVRSQGDEGHVWSSSEQNVTVSKATHALEKPAQAQETNQAKDVADKGVEDAQQAKQEKASAAHDEHGAKQDSVEGSAKSAQAAHSEPPNLGQDLASTPGH